MISLFAMISVYFHGNGFFRSAGSGKKPAIDATLLDIIERQPNRIIPLRASHRNGDARIIGILVLVELRLQLAVLKIAMEQCRKPLVFQHLLKVIGRRERIGNSAQVFFDV
jgi:hypothetical protein